MPRVEIGTPSSEDSGSVAAECDSGSSFVSQISLLIDLGVKVSEPDELFE